MCVGVMVCWLSVDGWAGTRISLGKIDILVGVGIKVVTTKAGVTNVIRG